MYYFTDVNKIYRKSHKDYIYTDIPIQPMWSALFRRQRSVEQFETLYDSGATMRLEILNGI